MPGQSGLDLLAWIKERDPLFGHDHRDGRGVRNVWSPSLCGVGRWISWRNRWTWRNCTASRQPGRGFDRSSTALGGIGDGRQMFGGGLRSGMLGTGTSGSRVRVDLCFHPKAGSGGAIIFQPLFSGAGSILLPGSPTFPGMTCRRRTSRPISRVWCGGWSSAGAPMAEVFLQNSTASSSRNWSHPGTFHGATSGGGGFGRAACAVWIDLATEVATGADSWNTGARFDGTGR